MDKKRLRVALKVLDAVKTQFPDTKQYIEDLIDEECLKKNICGWRNFLYKSRSIQLAQKNVFYFVVSMLRDVIKLTSLGIIFTCVLSRFSLPKPFEIFYW